jgi:hypothetical protein
MQLSDVEDKDIPCPILFLKAAKSLVEKINKHPFESFDFEKEISYFKLEFPKLENAYRESGGVLKKKTSEDLMFFKAKLLEDVNDSIAVVNDCYKDKKCFGGDVLPSDPEECLKGLELLEDQLMEEIGALQRKITKIKRSHCMVQEMLKGKKAIQAYDFTLFASEVKTKRPKNH